MDLPLISKGYGQLSIRVGAFTNSVIVQALTHFRGPCRGGRVRLPCFASSRSGRALVMAGPRIAHAVVRVRPFGVRGASPEPLPRAGANHPRHLSAREACRPDPSPRRTRPLGSSHANSLLRLPQTIPPPSTSFPGRPSAPHGHAPPWDMPEPPRGRYVLLLNRQSTMAAAPSGSTTRRVEEPTIQCGSGVIRS